MARARGQRPVAQGHRAGPDRSLVDAQVSGRYGTVPDNYEASAQKAVAWIEANREAMTGIPKTYLDRMLHDLKHGGVAALRAALYRCAELRDGKGILGVRK